MSILQWPASERPREKLAARGAAALSDAELLALFISSGTRSLSALDLGLNLLNHFGGLRQLFDASPEELRQVNGIGLAKSSQLNAILELSRRYLKADGPRGQSLTSSAASKLLFKSELRHQPNEVFAVLFLNNQHEMIRFEHLFNGTINSAQVHLREIVRRCLKYNAAALIVGHNHPSGISEPSQSDIAITRDLKKALQLIDVRLLDHLVVGDPVVSSFSELGLL